MTIRILHIIPTLEYGGAAKQLTLLAAGLPRDQFDVHVAVLEQAGPLEKGLREAQIPVHSIEKKWRIDPLAWFRLRRLIRKLNPQVVQSWQFTANFYGATAASAEKVPAVVATETRVDHAKHWHQWQIDRWLMKSTCCWVTTTTAVTEYAASHGLAVDKFEVIPSGVPLPLNEQPQLTREQLIAELKLPSQARLIAAVGRLTAQKRIKDLIWGADLVKCVRDDSHVLVIGDGPQRWRLERFSEQCETTDKVHFLGTRNDVARILPACECLWLGSGYEGQSNAILEAMAAGIPVIATDIPGNRDLVIPNETGFLIPAGDRAAFARQTLRLLNEDGLKQQMGTAARNRVQEMFTVKTMIDRYAELYQRLIQKS